MFGLAELPPLTHRAGTPAPTEPDEFVRRAVEVTATGLDLGVRRRVGFSRYAPGGKVEVLAIDGSSTIFPNSHQGHPRRLSEEERASLRSYIARTQSGTQLEPTAPDLYPTEKP